MNSHIYSIKNMSDVMVGPPHESCLRYISHLQLQGCMTEIHTLYAKHIYWILGFQGEVHSIWDLWTIDLQECKGDWFFNWTGHASIVGRDFFLFFCFLWHCLGVSDCGPSPNTPIPHDGSWLGTTDCSNDMRSSPGRFSWPTNYQDDIMAHKNVVII